MPDPERQPRRRIGIVGALLAAAALTVAGCSAATTAAGPVDSGSSTIAAAPSSAAPSAPSQSSTTAPASPSSDVPGPSSAPAVPVPATTAPAPVIVPGPAVAPLVLPDAAPVSLTIPAIGVTSALSSLGRNPDGTVEVPSLDDPNAGAGWFRDSPEPGSLGPSVILGHVDSREFGPGVFYDLQDLQPGDTVEIARDDGTVAVFAVDSVETVPKATFPTLQVYGNIDHAGLRLITCGGSFDENARSYDDNVIAFASLVSSRLA